MRTDTFYPHALDAGRCSTPSCLLDAGRCRLPACLLDAGYCILPAYLLEASRCISPSCLLDSVDAVYPHAFLMRVDAFYSHTHYRCCSSCLHAVFNSYRQSRKNTICFPVRLFVSTKVIPRGSSLLVAEQRQSSCPGAACILWRYCMVLWRMLTGFPGPISK